MPSTCIILFKFFINLFMIKLVSSCPIYLTVTSDNLTKSKLVANWRLNCGNDKPYLIGIYRQNPSMYRNEAPYEIIQNINETNQYITSLHFGTIKFPSGWNRGDHNQIETRYSKGKCLPFYISSFGYLDKVPSHTECLKIQPTWMIDENNVTNTPLKNLFIPGTLSSGAYESIYSDQSMMLKKFGLSQNLDVWTQLLFGVRYIEIKVGQSKNDFWIVNEDMMINPLKLILNDIKEFIRISNEIIIIDFTDFPIGFKNHPERHIKLLELLHTHIGDLAFKRLKNSKNSYEYTINDIRESGSNILITYQMDRLLDNKRDLNIIWPAWKRYSIKDMNDADAINLMEVLFNKTNNTEPDGWVFEGTRGFETSFNIDKSVRRTSYRANQINSKILKFIQNYEPWNFRANVVALDYILNSNLIDIAINKNIKNN